MTWTLRLRTDLLDALRADLDRPHPFAGERVAFLETGLGNRDQPEILILARRYWSIPDDEYIDDPSVGARIAGTAIRHAVERALAGNTGIFHVHMHPGRATPRFSSIDLREIPRIVQSLRSAAPQHAHGCLLLSRDACNALVWPPGAERQALPGRIAAVGRPLRIFTVRGEWT